MPIDTFNISFESKRISNNMVLKLPEQRQEESYDNFQNVLQHLEGMANSLTL